MSGKNHNSKKRRGNLYQRIVQARHGSGHKNNVCCRGHLRVNVCKKKYNISLTHNFSQQHNGPYKKL